MVEDRNAEVLDLLQRGEDVGIEFERVIGLDDEDDLLRRGGENVEEGIVQSLGNADREAGVEADPFQVGNGCEADEEGGERLVAE